MARGRPRKNSTAAVPTANPAPASQPTLERDLFLAADKLRKNLEPSDYKHVVLGLIFLRHISLAFEARHDTLLREDPAAAEGKRGAVLFIDARKLGFMVDRTRKEFSDADIANIAGTYHAWRGETDSGSYEDVPGFCKAATLEEIRGHGHVLTPGRYVGAADIEDDEVPFAERFDILARTLEAPFAEADSLTTRIREALARVRSAS
jgi:type I restriction-modification system DNA methylase subunit